jgi:ribosome recycling factor
MTEKQTRPATVTADTQKKTTAAPAERRKRVALRRLIDEMLAEIRAAANEDNWTADARAQAEADLARIMDQVRHEAMRAEPGPRARRAKSD